VVVTQEALLALERLIQVVVVAVELAGLAQPVVLAALELSSSNTKHLLNPYSHSKVLASGLHLLA
jgi:hypothetical protein